MKIRKARRNKIFQNDASLQKFQLRQTELFLPAGLREMPMFVSAWENFIVIFFCPEIPLERTIWN